MAMMQNFKVVKNVNICWHDVVYPVNLTGPLIQSMFIK